MWDEWISLIWILTLWVSVAFFVAKIHSEIVATRNSADTQRVKYFFSLLVHAFIGTVNSTVGSLHKRVKNRNAWKMDTGEF